MALWSLPPLSPPCQAERAQGFGCPISLAGGWGAPGVSRGQGVLMAVPLASFSPDVGGPADPIAPTIIVPPRNTSVVAGTSEVTMECVANARRVASGQTGRGWGTSLLAPSPQVPSHQGTWVPRDGVRWGFGGVWGVWGWLSTYSWPPQAADQAAHHLEEGRGASLQRHQRLQPPAHHPQSHAERQRLLRVRGRAPQQQRACRG